MLLKNEAKEREKTWKQIEGQVLYKIRKNILPIFLNEFRTKARDFKEWESMCLDFDSFKFFDPIMRKKLETIFGKSQNFNYFVFWDLIVGELDG